ncbi:MAG TPA: succinylglutamate desuccinylase/aspartoacylase family protein [Haliangiales bacterium]|nr:succinylglutamate desuccinylase/aspartoacylase family protein [Haliangiales bacterium]
MGMLTEINRGETSTAPPAKRSIADLLAPLNRLAQTSPNLIAKPGGTFPVNEKNCELPRYVFLGPKAGDEPVRIGLFAAIHGDEPEGSHALIQFLTLLDHHPELAAGYCLFVYPVCNPTGFEDNTRYSRRGRDLNREFWNNSNEPEVQLLQREIYHHAFHGIISLHTDDTTRGIYGFVRGATLTQHLLKPALRAAELVLPRNYDEIIDGFEARNGIIRDGYQGVLSAPAGVRPRPFEIILETPQAAPRYQQERALVAAMQTILAEYRKLMAYAPNL